MNNKKIMSKVIASSLVLALGTINAVPVFAYSKDETVYTKANANGSSYQTIVSEHLKNSDNAELLKDMSTLLNIKKLMEMKKLLKMELRLNGRHLEMIFIIREIPIKNYH